MKRFKDRGYVIHITIISKGLGVICIQLAEGEWDRGLLVGGLCRPDLGIKAQSHGHT